MTSHTVSFLCIFFVSSGHKVIGLRRVPQRSQLDGTYFFYVLATLSDCLFDSTCRLQSVAVNKGRVELGLLCV